MLIDPQTLESKKFENPLSYGFEFSGYVSGLRPDVSTFRFFCLYARSDFASRRSQVCRCHKYYQRNHFVMLNPVYCLPCQEGNAEMYTGYFCPYHKIFMKKITCFSLCSECDTLFDNLKYCVSCAEQLDACFGTTFLLDITRIGNYCNK